MITKERLEELIEQEAMIYTITINDRLDYFRLKKDWYVMNDELREYKLSKHSFRHWWIGNLYENKEEVEWIIEFGCIERTERLELPTWEEFCNGKFCHFISKECKYSLSPDLIHDTIFLYECVWGGGFYVHSRWKLTKENYTLACRKAKELFLGEKK